MYLDSKINNPRFIKDEYALFLEAPTPLFPGDHAITGLNHKKFYTLNRQKFLFLKSIVYYYYHIITLILIYIFPLQIFLIRSSY